MSSQSYCCAHFLRKLILKPLPWGAQNRFGGLDFAKIGVLESLKCLFSGKKFSKKNHDFFVHISALSGGRMEWSGAQSGAQFIHTEHVCLVCAHTSGVLVVSKTQKYRQISFKRAPQEHRTTKSRFCSSSQTRTIFIKNH